MNVISAEEANKIRLESLKDQYEKENKEMKLLKTRQKKNAVKNFLKATENWDISKDIVDVAKNGKTTIRVLIDFNYGECGHIENYIGKRTYEGLEEYKDFKKTLEDNGYIVDLECQNSLKYGMGSDSIPKCDGMWTYLIINLK